MNKETAEELIKMVKDAKWKKDLNGSFYVNGWQDACEFILGEILDTYFKDTHFEP